MFPHLFYKFIQVTWIIVCIFYITGDSPQISKQAQTEITGTCRPDKKSMAIPPQIDVMKAKTSANRPKEVC